MKQIIVVAKSRVFQSIWTPGGVGVGFGVQMGSGVHIGPLFGRQGAGRSWELLGVAERCRGCLRNERRSLARCTTLHFTEQGRCKSPHPKFSC